MGNRFGASMGAGQIQQELGYIPHGFPKNHVNAPIYNGNRNGQNVLFNSQDVSG